MWIVEYLNWLIWKQNISKHEEWIKSFQEENWYLKILSLETEILKITESSTYLNKKTKMVNLVWSSETIALTGNLIFWNLDGGSNVPQAGALCVLVAMALQCSVPKFATCVLYHSLCCTGTHDSCAGSVWVWCQNAGNGLSSEMESWAVCASNLADIGVFHIWIYSVSLTLALWGYVGSGSPDDLWIAL